MAFQLFRKPFASQHARSCLALTEILENNFFFSASGRWLGSASAVQGYSVGVAHCQRRDTCGKRGRSDTSWTTKGMFFLLHTARVKLSTVTEFGQMFSFLFFPPLSFLLICQASDMEVPKSNTRQHETFFFLGVFGKIFSTFSKSKDFGV